MAKRFFCKEEHRLQGLINYIEEILEEHTFGDDVEINSISESQIIFVHKTNLWIYLDHDSGKFKSSYELGLLLPQLPEDVIIKLHEIVLTEYDI